MDWLNKILGRNVTSAQIAKNRLKVVLSYDRTNLTPDMLTMLQEEIVTAISRHLDIDREGMTFSTQRGDSGDHLIADIPVRGVRAPRPTPELPPPPPMPIAAGSGATHRKKHKKR